MHKDQPMNNAAETTKTLDEQLAEQGLITASAAAKLIRKTIYTIYRKVDSGEIEGALVMGHRYVKLASLELWIKKTTDKTGEKALGRLLRHVKE